MHRVWRKLYIVVQTQVRTYIRNYVYAGYHTVINTYGNAWIERNSMASALTTVDNPYDPFKDWEHWFLFDVVNGYNSCGYLARIATTSDQLTDEENLKEIDRAIDEIVSYNPKLYKKVESDVLS